MSNDNNTPTPPPTIPDKFVTMFMFDKPRILREMDALKGCVDWAFKEILDLKVKLAEMAGKKKT